MSYIRHYILEAKPEAVERLHRVLADLRNAVIGLPGAEGVEILQADGQPATFHLVERWATSDDHAAALAGIPREVMDAMKATLGGPPTAYSLRPV